MSRMYEQNRKSLNWFVGCKHDCVYCKPSFQAQMKRQLHNCKTCYDFTPHAHLERLTKNPPKTNNGEFIFFPSSGDPAFASDNQWNIAIEYMAKHIDTTFLVQSKDPICFNIQSEIHNGFPDNVVLGTTLESDLIYFVYRDCHGEFKTYMEISKAPEPYWRYTYLLSLKHQRKFVTIEPIIQFGLLLPRMIEEIDPEFVYIGYDNHNCKLPEPPLVKTKALIEELELFTEVRQKTIRKAWWEQK